MLSLFPSNNCKAVLFDCDGVLFDTETIYLQKKEAFLKTKGITPTDDELSKMIGFAFPQALKLCYPEIDSDELAKEYYSQCHYDLIDYRSIFDTESLCVLQYLRAKGMKLGCVSNSNASRLHQALKDNNILNYFDCVISAEMVNKGKPDPAIYLYAVNTLNVFAEQCLAVEDSAAGIKAAKRAGCMVTAKKHPRFKINQSESNVIIESLKEIMEIV